MRRTTIVATVLALVLLIVVLSEVARAGQRHAYVYRGFIAVTNTKINTTFPLRNFLLNTSTSVFWIDLKNTVRD